MGSVCWWFVITQMIIQHNAETRLCSASTDPSCICTDPDRCLLECSGKDKCKGSDMKLGCKSGYPCNVICNSAGEENACEDATIDGSTATSLNVICRDKKSCSNTKVNCGTGDCTVICLSIDSTGSNCQSLTLNCGPNACSIHCENAPNMCSDVRVNTLPATQSFECVEEGIGNTACTPIHQQIAPFALETVNPTSLTLTPTYIPTKSPSKTPTNTPTDTTLSPTKYPTHNPLLSTATTKNPSIAPSYNPSLSPSKKPTLFPSHNPSKSHVFPSTDIPTPPPTTKPTTTSKQKPSKTPTTASKTPKPSKTSSPTIGVVLQPTVPSYYVVGEISASPTKQTENIYADPHAKYEHIITTILENWLYVAIAGGMTLCCFICICVKCCCNGKKKVAQPARYNSPENMKKHRNQRAEFLRVKSPSDRGRAGNIQEEDEFIPPPPIGPPPNEYSSSRDAEIEGLKSAVTALPSLCMNIGTLAAGNVEVGGGFIVHNEEINLNANNGLDDDDGGSYLEILDDMQLIDANFEDDDGFEISQVIENDVEMLDDMPLRQ